MRNIIGTILWFAILVPSWVFIGIPVLIGDVAQEVADQCVNPLLDRVQRWMDADLRSESVDRPGWRD